MTGSAYGQQKTHSRFQPWVLVKIDSISTSTDGLAYYYEDYYRRNLSNDSVHYGGSLAFPLPSGQALFPGFSECFRANRCATHHPTPAIIAPPTKSTK